MVWNQRRVFQAIKVCKKVKYVFAISTALALGLMGCSSPETSGPDSVPSASGKSDKVELGQSSGHLYDAAFAQMKSRIDAQLDQPLIVPVPKDAGGGLSLIHISEPTRPY